MYVGNSVGATRFDDNYVNSQIFANRYVPNLIVNPRMQISQQWGNTAGATNAYYMADEWFSYFTTSAGVISCQRVQSVTPRGSKDRIRLSVTTADTSLAAGEFLGFRTKLEGNRIAHLKFGTAGAVQTVLRFGFKGPAGTYTAALGNSAGNRSYVVNFTVSVANTDTEITLMIPGDTSGTWLTDTGIGANLYIMCAAGTTFQGTNATWQSGQYWGTSATSNGLGANTNVFELFDVGLYEDPDELGIAPRWVANDEAFDLAECYRYLRPITGGAGAAASATAFEIGVNISPPMRTAPTYTATGPISIEDPSTGTKTQSSGSVSSQYNSAMGTKLILSNFTGLTTDIPYILTLNSSGYYILANARM